MTRVILSLAFAALAAAVWVVRQPPSGEADLILINGNIYTVDDRLGRVEALAIDDGRIVAAGTSEEIQHWDSPHTKTLDLEGRFVLPGFNDAHTHFGEGGQGLLTVNMLGTRSLTEFQQRIRSRLPEFDAGEWIVGSGWDQSLWVENRYPTREDLDAVSTGHPMVFTRVDGHSVIVNSRALGLAGITRETPDPEGGDIVRDAQGEPTGWLKESAVDLVNRLVPEPTRERRKQGLLRAMEAAARVGVTSIQDNSAWEDFLALRELKTEGRLTLRVTEWLPFNSPLEKLKKLCEEGGSTDPWLRTGALKALADGSGGSRSAAMFEPFANEPDNRGILFYEPDEMKRMVTEREAAGFQIAFHAIGDRAIRLVLDAFQAAREANGQPGSRHRIEHVQYLDPADVSRFRELGVIASMQPVHLLAEIRWTSTLLGPERESKAYVVKSLLEDGAAVALGTDFPVERLNPLRGLYAAVAREFEEGGPEGGWQPQEKITIEEAIRAYTYGSAFAEFEEDRKGTLAPGQFADLVVLSKDITAVSAPEILSAEVLMTMVGGKIVYEKR